jgi:hypothetical protein
VRRFLVTVLILAVWAYILYALVSGLSPVAFAYRLDKVDAIATEVAGRPANVRCKTPSEWVDDDQRLRVPGTAAYAWPSTGRAVLGPRACTGLFFLLHDPTGLRLQELNPGINVDFESAFGLTVLLHEATHMAGNRDEADTQCSAMKLLPVWLERLVPENRRKRLLAWAWQYHNGMPYDYRKGCFAYEQSIV